MKLPLSALLRRRLKKMPVPENYYRGISGSDLVIPKSVLCFCRNSVKELGLGQFYHHRHVMVFNLETAGTILLDGALFHFPCDHAIVIAPYQFHRFLSIEKSQLCWLFITFEYDDPQKILPIKNVPIKLNQSLLQEIELFTKTSNTADISVQNRFVLQASAIINQMSAIAANRTIPLAAIRKAMGTLAIIEMINQYIYAHIAQSFTVADISHAVSMSASRVRALFRDQVGISLGHCVQEIRLCKASGMLGAVGMNISEVAFACGYESLFSFSRAFKKRFGMSPRNYRAKKIE